MRLVLSDLRFGQGCRGRRTARKGCQIALIAVKGDNNCARVMHNSSMAFPPTGSFAALAHNLGLCAHPFAIGGQHAACPPRTGVIAGRTFGINDCDLRAA
jgi:hypothetical protein